MKGSFMIEAKFLTMTSPNAHRSSDQFYYRQLQMEPSQRITRYKDFLKQVNLTNGVIVSNDTQSASKKFVYFVGKGNNHCLVQSLFKSRFWWVEGSSPDSANFLWTQLKKLTFFDLQNPFVKEGIDAKTVYPNNIHNHLTGNGSLGNKKSLYQNLKKYCEQSNLNIFDLVPLTFHIGAELAEFI